MNKLAETTKRPHSEVAEDSMNEMISNVDNLCKKDKPNLKDVMCCIRNMMMMMAKRDERVEELEKNLSDVQSKQVSQSLEISSNKEEITALSTKFDLLGKKTENHEMSLHIIEQKRIDNDVFISYFSKKPSASTVAQNLLKLAAIPLESLSDAYTIPLGPKAKSTPQPNASQKYGVVVCLKDYSSKRKLIEARKKMGVLKWGQLEPQVQRQSFDSSIRFANRLSAFNTKVQRILINAKKLNEIADFRFQNGLFRCKFSSDGEWITIGDQGSLAFIHQEESINENNE